MDLDEGALGEPGAGHGVRLPPYLVAGGRTEPVPNMLPESLVLAPLGVRQPDALAPEERSAVALCRTQQSVAEVSAALRKPLYLTKIILSNLLDAGLLAMTATVQRPNQQRSLLEAVLVGLHNL